MQKMHIANFMYRGIINKNIIGSIIKQDQDFRKLKSLVDIIAIKILLEIEENPQFSNDN